jgi:imidazolonepropionase-like amidohydrolase
VLSEAKDGKRPQFFMEELEAIIETANDYNMTTAAHAHGAEGMRRAVEAGITSIEHGTMMTEEVMDMMIEKGTWYVPTITAGKAVEENAKKPGYYPAIVVPKALEIGPQIQATAEKAYKRGVPIAFGTDAGVFPHGENAKEFRYMVEAGIPMSECLKMATINAAKLLRIEDKAGTIEKGKWADLVALDENPLESPEAMFKINFVMKEGVIFKEKGYPTPETD